MESKMIVLSGVLALLMVSSGFLLMVNETVNDEETATDEEAQQDSVETINTSPDLLNAAEFIYQWNGGNASINGFVLDEELSSTTVTVVIIDANTLEQIGEPHSTTPTCLLYTSPSPRDS